MQSPFPGMDPYLEARWGDVHVRFVAYVPETLQPQLPRDLRARSEERVLLEALPDEDALTTYRSDVAVIQTPRSSTRGEPSRAMATVEPVIVDVYEGPEVDRFVHIIDVSSGNRVVTAIEILSPWNKGPGRLNLDYRRKLSDYARAGVNVVEIDLLRSLRGRLEVGQQDLPADRQAPYLTCVRRARYPARWEIYPMLLQQPLPAVPIPLRETDADVLLDLQPLIERVYTAGGHDDIDYSRPPVPPLDGEAATWADALLRAAALRS